MDSDFTHAVREANVGYSFSIIEREDKFKILANACDKNYENEVVYNELTDIARFLRKVAVEFDVVAWFVQDDATTGYATYVAFAQPSEANADLVESDGFWFHEDAC